MLLACVINPQKIFGAVNSRLRVKAYLFSMVYGCYRLFAISLFWQEYIKLSIYFMIKMRMLYKVCKVGGSRAK